jgi:hypothetical protein
MQLQFSSQESFNTAVRDLVQENPDTPIGGGYASPLKQFDSLNIDIGCCERKSRLDPLTLHTSYSPKDATKKPLKLHTNRSEDCVNSFSLSETSKSKKVEAKSEASNEMVIASTDPASEPNAGIAFQMLDGTRSRKNTAVGNITQDSIPASIMHSCSLSPTAPETENSCDCIAAVFLENIVTLDGWFSQKKRPEAKTQGQELEVNGMLNIPLCMAHCRGAVITGQFRNSYSKLQLHSSKSNTRLSKYFLISRTNISHRCHANSVVSNRCLESSASSSNSSQYPR